MAPFRHLAPTKAHPFYSMPFPRQLADIPEPCYPAAAVRGVAERVSIPLKPDALKPLRDSEKYLSRNHPHTVGISTILVMGGYDLTALTEAVLSSSVGRNI